MILTCPNCDTRYSVDGSKFPAAGRAVRCAKCGHSWHQSAEAPEPEVPMAPEPVAEAAPEPVAAAASAGDAPMASSASPTRAFAAAQAPKERAPLAPQIAVVAGWAGLILVVLAIAWSAYRYRQDIAVIWPQSAGVYSSLGMHVNASGIDFRQVDYRRQSEDGQIVLEVTGRIVNAGTRELPVPQTVRVTLSDASNHELYHWTFKPTVTTLKAGASVPFTTRLSSPPDAARHLEVRFAKD